MVEVLSGVPVFTTVCICLCLSACAARAESGSTGSASAPNIDVTFRELGQASDLQGSNKWWYDNEVPHAFAMQGIGVLTEGALASKGSPQEHHGGFGGPAPTLRIRALPDGRVMSELGTVKPSEVIDTYAITASQQYCATITAKGDLRLWNLADGHLVGDYPGGGAFNDPYRLCVAISPGGKYVAAAGGEVIVWEYGSREIARRVKPTNGYGIVDVGFSPDGLLIGLGLATAESFQGLRSRNPRVERFEIRDLAKGAVNKSIDVEPSSFIATGFRERAGHWYYIHYVYRDGAHYVAAWDLVGGRNVGQFPLGRNRAPAFEAPPALLVDGKCIMVMSKLIGGAGNSLFRGGSDPAEMLHIFDLGSGRLVKKAALPKERECRVLASDGSHMLTLDYGGSTLAYGVLPAYTLQGPLRWWEINLSGLVPVHPDESISEGGTPKTDKK